MTGPSYPAARRLAQRLDARLAGRAACGDIAGLSPPDAEAIEELVSAAFWASLRSEEGRPPKISLAFLLPEQTTRPLKFEPRFRLGPDVLVRLAPSVERPNVHIGIARYDGQLDVWGITRTVFRGCFVLEVVAPGLLVVKSPQADPSMKFANIAVLEGPDVKFTEPRDISSDTAPSLSSFRSFYASAGRNAADDILVRTAIAMRAHGHGGSLLVVPKNSGRWMDSVVRPVTYSVIAPFPDIHTFLQLGSEGTPASGITLQSAVDALAGITAVDGAAIISDLFEPLAFGAKILNRDGTTRVQQVLLTEPIEGVEDRIVDAAHLGGTRHLSAAQFVHDQRNAIALVASQDGRFTLLAWSEAHRIVHAHRMDALLV
jgi:hypothetical protein